MTSFMNDLLAVLMFNLTTLSDFNVYRDHIKRGDPLSGCGIIMILFQDDEESSSDEEDEEGKAKEKADLNEPVEDKKNA